jgi:T1SS-143 domain-containing protein
MSRFSHSSSARKLRLNGPSSADLQSWLNSRPDHGGSRIGKGRGRDRRRGRAGNSDPSAADPILAVITDKADYAPGEVATITVTGVSPGGEVRFSLKDAPNDPGDDGDIDDYGRFSVVDGGTGDGDGAVNGTVVAQWRVPSDDDGSGTGTPDALNATILLAVTDRSSGSKAFTSFTDAGAISSGAVTDVDETAGLQPDTPTTQQDPGAVNGQVDGGVDKSDFSTALSNGSPEDKTALTTLRGLRDFDLVDTATIALSGASDANSAGANAVAITAPNVTNLKFAQDSGGNPYAVYGGSMTGGVDSGLEAIDGGKIYLFRHASDDNLLLGYTSNGVLKIALYLQETKTSGQVTGAKLWLINYEPIKHSSLAKDETATFTNLFASVNAGANFDLNALASGQNVWNAFGDTGYQVIVMADEAVSKGQTVNTSKGGGSTTIGNTNQLIEGRNPDKDADGEAMSFTFAQRSAALLTADKRVFSTIAPDSLYDARTVSWSISQTQGGGNFAVATIKAFSTALASGQAFADDVDRSIQPNDDTVVFVDAVSIKDGSGNPVIAATRTGGNSSKTRTAGNANFNVLIAFQADGTVEISGLREKDTITYSTAAPHNRVIFQNTGVSSSKTNGATTLDWDIGSFSIADAQSATTQLTVRVEDDAPTIAAAVFGFDATVRLDDDAVIGAAGNSGGIDDDIDNANTAGTLSYSAGFDGLQSVAFLTTGAPAGFTYTSSGSDLLIKQGATTVLTLTLNSLTGAYTVSQNAPIAHAAGTNENNIEFSVTYRVTDRDTDFVEGTLLINVDDDTPTAVAITAISGSVDEEGNGGNALPDGSNGDLSGTATSFSTGNLASLFNAGADSPLTFSFAATTDAAIAAAITATGTLSGNSALSSGGTPLSYAVSGNTLTASAGASTVFTLSINTPSSGGFSFNLAGHLDHASANGENDLVLSLGALIKATDFDGDAVNANPSALQITVDDDAPLTSGAIAILLDDDALSGGNADGTNDDPNSVNASGTLGFHFGADSGGTVAFLDTGAPAGFTYSKSGSDLLIKQGAITVLTLSLNSATGAYSVIQNAPIQDPAGDNENNVSFTVTYEVSDKDDDKATNTFTINVDDDSPMLMATPGNPGNAVPTSTTPNAYSGSGAYAYSIGSDRRSSYAAGNSDFVLPVLSGYAGSAALINPTVSWASESASQATFNFSFSYRPNPNNVTTASETGTLVFDKINGTYTVNLSPLDSYVEFLTTSNPNNKFVEYQVPTGGSGSPEVVTIELRSDFFVQFTGDKESGGGSPTLFSAGGNTAYQEGETVSAADTSVLVSSVAQGVGGNTVQAPEVLDFNFFSANPLNNTSKPSDRIASGLFMKFDGFGSEDMVVILKLIDPSNGNQTTKALVVDSGDIYTNKPGSTPPPFYPISLDNNDGAVIIERNDYCFGAENWRISGAQILASTQKLTGSGINFNRATGASGGSSGSQVFSKDSTGVNGTEDGDVFKIIELGFVTEINPTPQVLLNFAVQVEDTDGDRTAVSNLGVAITGSIRTGTAAADTLIGTAAGDTFSGLAGTDRFQLPNLASSLLPDFDVITDYASAESIDAPGPIVASLTGSLGVAANLSASSIAAVLTTGTFTANQAAAFTVAGLGGTFVALNDPTPGFQAATDAVLFLQGYSVGVANPVTLN